MKNFRVGVKIYNVYDIEAENKQEAEQKARELSCHDILEDCDFNISYVDEEKIEINVKSSDNATDFISGMKEVGSSTKMSAFIPSENITQSFDFLLSKRLEKSIKEIEKISNSILELQKWRANFYSKKSNEQD